MGGRPPSAGKAVGDIPRGIEILVKKAAVDGGFRERLLRDRGRAARAIGLELTAEEEKVLAAAPEAQLAAVIARTSVSPKLRPAFMGYAAAVMLAALGATLGCESPTPPPVEGIRPDEPPFAFEPSAEVDNANQRQEAGQPPAVRAENPAPVETSSKRDGAEKTKGD